MRAPMRILGGILLFLLTLVGQSRAAEIKTNEVLASNAPAWLTESKVNRVVEHIQSTLEWDIRRISAVWHTDEAEFEKSHGMGPAVLAYSNGPSNTVHVGPRVSASNFDAVFGHELVHVILYQKYKGAVPKWLEEGLANYVGKWGEIDYKRLASGGAPEDVRTLVHPFRGIVGKSGDLTESASLHYMTSKALVEMIASKCSLSDLLQLSVGKSVESYLSTYCGIPDINVAFKEWVRKKAGKR